MCGRPQATICTDGASIYWKRRMTLRFAKTLQIGIAGLILCGSAGAQENPKPAVVSPERVFAQKIALQGVPNFGQVTASLFRGAQPSDDGFGVLAKMGVGIGVDLRC